MWVLAALLIGASSDCQGPEADVLRRPTAEAEARLAPTACPRGVKAVACAGFLIVEATLRD
jgi:hypothetical protein